MYLKKNCNRLINFCHFLFYFIYCLSSLILLFCLYYCKWDIRWGFFLSHYYYNNCLLCFIIFLIFFSICLNQNRFGLLAVYLSHSSSLSLSILYFSPHNGHITPLLLNLLKIHRSIYMRFFFLWFYLFINYLYNNKREREMCKGIKVSKTNVNKYQGNLEPTKLYKDIIIIIIKKTKKKTLKRGRNRKKRDYLKKQNGREIVSYYSANNNNNKIIKRRKIKFFSFFVLFLLLLLDILCNFKDKLFTLKRRKY